MICRDDVSAEVYVRRGSVIWGEFFYVLQHLLLPADRPDERLHGYISAVRYEISNHWFWERVTNKACPYSACSHNLDLHEPLIRKAFTTEPLRRMNEPLRRKIERPPSEDNWAPSSEDNSTVLCDYRIDPPRARRIIEGLYLLILVNWSCWRKTKVLSGKTWSWTCSSLKEYWACLRDKQRFGGKSKR